MIISNQLQKPNPDHRWPSGRCGSEWDKAESPGGWAGLAGSGGLGVTPAGRVSRGGRWLGPLPPLHRGPPNIHSANTDGYSLCAGHFCPGDTGRTRPQGPRASYRTNTGNKPKASSCRRGKKQEEGERRAGAWEWRVRGCGGAAV